MKILYVTDLHGVDDRYYYLQDMCSDKKYDIVINGGDMLPRKHQDIFIYNQLFKHFEYFNKKKIPYLCQLANDDLRIHDKLFDSTTKNFKQVYNIANQSHTVNGYTFVGYNNVPDYPFRLKDRCRRDDKGFISPPQFGSAIFSDIGEVLDWQGYLINLPTIKEELDNLLSSSELNKTITVIHAPPSRLGLDVCGDGRKVGSEAVYSFLERKQPLLSFHGHIHESPDISGKWYNLIDKTYCIQPGQLHSNKLTYAVIELDPVIGVIDFKRFVV